MVLMDLPKEIVRAREEKDLSKSKAAIELGVARLTYTMWEKGAWIPQLDKAQAIASFTGLSKEDVVSWLARQSGMLDANAHYETRYVND